MVVRTSVGKNMRATFEMQEDNPGKNRPKRGKSASWWRKREGQGR